MILAFFMSFNELLKLYLSMIQALEITLKILLYILS